MAKKVVKKVTKVEMPVVAPIMPTPSTPRLNPKFLTYGLVIVAIALLVYKFGPYFVPAMVDNQPVTRLALWSRLEKSYGTQTLDDLVNEKILDNAIAESGVKVDDAKMKAQIESLEAQFKDIGGLDQALEERGLSRAELEKQVRTQLAVEELLSDKIMPTDAEVKQEFDDNATTLYKDQKFEDVKDAITTQLKEAKLRDAFLAWFDEVKKSVKVKNFGL